MKRKKGIRELYAENPQEAEKQIWGEDAHSESRRGFLRNSALAVMGAVLGAQMVFGKNFPSGIIPAGLLDNKDWESFPGKHPDLVVLNDRPVNMETPAHLLDDEITPGDKLFVRNNGIPPENVDPNTWTLEITGESVVKPVTFTLKDLKKRFPVHSYQLVIECGGNGRKEFYPPAKGNQWSTGAVGAPVWTGVRLKDVLEHVGIKSDAVYVAYEGADTHLSGDPKKKPISRGVPIAKAMEEESLIAWEMNGEPIPALNGHPLRMVIGGWPASTSGKWLNKILVRNIVHDGPKMTGSSYRVPCKPVAPGTHVEDKDMCIIESMPVKSLITYPKSGAMVKLGQTMNVRGHAWAGDLSVKQMDISIDYGATWQRVDLKPPKNRLAWQRWSGQVKFPEKGYYEVWARAIDSEGTAQPMVVPNWNPKGYLNNACHRIAVKVV